MAEWLLRFGFYLEGIERALQHAAYIAGDQVTIADIAFACDVSQFLRERLMRSGLAAASLPVISENAETTFPRAFAHLSALIEEPEFNRYLDDYGTASGFRGFAISLIDAGS